MKVVYLLNGAALYGGVKVVFQHVRALRRLHVDASVVSPDPAPWWFPDLAGGYRQVESLAPQAIGPADVAVGTIWFTVPIALAVPGALACHLCQCYEAQYHGVAHQAATIEATYRLPALKLAISPHLVELLHTRLGVRAAYVPQPFEPQVFHPPVAERVPDGKLRVLVCGQWQLDIKGVQWGLRALRPLANEGWLQLVRLSQDASDEELSYWPEAERHVGVPPSAVPEIIRSVDLYLGLSSEVEGFGLPALEAMGCARPCVLTDISAVRALDPDQRASARVDFGDGEALRAAVRSLRFDSDLRRRLGTAGREIAIRFDEARTARALIEVFSQAHSHPSGPSAFSDRERTRSAGR
jgi:glycosyltransferase involved in cell wall biosynthesis